MCIICLIFHIPVINFYCRHFDIQDRRGDKARSDIENRINDKAVPVISDT